MLRIHRWITLLAVCSLVGTSGCIFTSTGGQEAADTASSDTGAVDTDDGGPAPSDGGADTADSGADTADGATADCDSESPDRGCSCNYEDESRGVCEGSTVGSDGTCNQPDNYVDDEGRMGDGCGDMLDNDCDGQLNENCQCREDVDCYTGPDETRETGICEGGTTDCTDKGEVVCDGETTPEETESCDGNDNDCDGVIDEGCPCEYEPPGAGSSGETGVCENSTVVEDGSCQPPEAYERNEESCDDDTDNDCDGDTDCNDEDCKAAGAVCL